MKSRVSKWISGMVLVGMLTLTGVGVLGYSPPEGAGKLEGTWLNEVKIVTCPEHAVIAAFQSMTTYMRGGVAIEGGGPITPPPAVSRSAGHGIWEHTGQHAFRVFFRFHSFDNLGRRVRITEVTTLPRLIDGDDAETPDVIEPYYLSAEGTSTITNLNPDNGEVISVIEACNEATSRPILFED